MYHEFLAVLYFYRGHARTCNFTKLPNNQTLEEKLCGANIMLSVTLRQWPYDKIQMLWRGLIALSCGAGVAFLVCAERGKEIRLKNKRSPALITVLYKLCALLTTSASI